MSTVYVDSCAAWGTVVGGFVANVLLGGLGKSYGLIKEAYQEVFNCDTAPLLLAGGLIYTLMYINAIGVHLASQRFGRRKVVLIGALGSFVSLMVAAFATNVILWVIAIGVGVGASLSCVYFSIFTVVGECFKRYIGTANGLSVAGVSIGQMVFPTLITYLDQAYGTRLSTTIAAVLCLHLIITAVLMPARIVSPEQEAEEKAKRRQLDGMSTPDKGVRKRMRRRFAWLRRRRGQPDSSSGYELEAGFRAPSYARQETTETTSMTGDHYPAGEDGNPLIPKVTGEGDSRTRPEDSVELVCFDPDGVDQQPPALTTTLLVIYVIAKMFADVGDVSISFIAPSHGNKLGFSQELVSYGIAFSGLFDLVARLGIGWLTDRPCCVGRRGLLLGIVWLVEGINALAFSWLDYFAAANTVGQEPPTRLRNAYFLCFAIHGITSGMAMTQMIVVLTDWVGRVKMPRSLAITMFVLGVVISPSQYLMGYLEDMTHQYVLSLQLCCVILLLAGFLLLLEFPARWFFRRWGRRRKRSVKGVIALDHLMQKGESSTDKTAVWEVLNSDTEPLTATPEVEQKPASTGNGLGLSGGVGLAGDAV